MVRTINRVVLQEYGIVIATKNQKNKLIFKVKDREEYLYGNETISNFVYIRECIADRRIAELEIIEASIYER